MARSGRSRYRSSSLGPASPFPALAAPASRVSSIWRRKPDLAPRLEAIVAEHPLPPGWSLAPSGKVAPLPSAASLELTLGEATPGGAAPRGAEPCGLRYMAAHVGLEENLYSTSASRALSLGLTPLETIVLPRRALAVDGLWPGMRGYPFYQTLYLILRGLKGRPDAAIKKWLADTASALATRDSRPIKVAAAGDIQVGEAEWPLLDGREAGLSSLLRGGVLDLLRHPDIAVANIEAPISARGYPNPLKRYLFRMPPGSGAALRRAGLGLVLSGTTTASTSAPEPSTIRSPIWGLQACRWSGRVPTSPRPRRRVS